MVTRFTPAARSVLGRAYEYAKRDRAGEIREEDLLEGLLTDDVGRRLLGDRVADEDALPQIRAEVADSRRKAGLTAAEEAALSDLGIDVDAVVRQVEDRLGVRALAADPPPRSHWPAPGLSAGAARVLAEAERQSSGTPGSSIDVDHVVLALVAAPSALSESLAARGVGEDTVRNALAARSTLGGPR